MWSSRMHNLISSARALPPRLAAQVEPIDRRAIYKQEVRAGVFHARHHRLEGDRAAAARSLDYANRFLRLLTGAA
jgi:hypothetical protein